MFINFFSHVMRSGVPKSQNVRYFGRKILSNWCHILVSITDPYICKSGKTRLVEKSQTGITAYCTEKLEYQLPLNNVYRFDRVIGIYYLSVKESHICYDSKVLPIMTMLTSLTGGKFYEIGK